MDVQCDRCKTEYEFDDALVSGRGTTVKCTNCGFQFKVHKQGNQPADDRWIIRTTENREIVYHALKDLQKAIIAKQVGRHDTLARGGGPPRPLGSIAELAPFFEEQRKRTTSIPPPLPPAPGRRPSTADYTPNERRGASGTQLGLPGPPQRRSDPPEPAPAEAYKATSSRPPPPNAPRGDTLRPPESTGVPPPSQALPLNARQAAFAATSAAVQPAPVVAVGATRPDEIASSQNGHASARERSVYVPDDATAHAPSPDVSSPLPPPTRPVRREMPSYDETSDMMPIGVRGDLDSGLPSHRPARRVGGWVVAFVLVVCVGIGGVLVGRKYVPGGPAPVASAPLDPRAQDFLRTGERALDDGDLETAKESFDKASVIAEKDARVLLDVARLSTMRADVPWLKQRLSPQDASEETRRGPELAAKAKSAADAALAAAPDDTAAIRVKMDALRIAGEREAARAYVTRIIMNAQQPETAYVLAALDLAEPEPLWKTIIERLRLAAQAEGNAGRARAALVYALARSGDPVGAKAELEKLGQLARPHPLFSPLKAFIEKAPAKADAGALAASHVVDVNALPRPGGGVGVGGGGAGGGGGGGDGPPAGDAKSLVAQGNRALSSHDYDRANTLFAAALDKNPGDSEAQAGLGDVARAQHNLSGARSSYQKAVAINGHYLPALIGLADVEWEMGDHASAQRRYKEMVDNFPEPALPRHVKDRAEAPAPAPATPPTPPTTQPTQPTQPSTGGGAP